MLDFLPKVFGSAYVHGYIYIAKDFPAMGIVFAESFIVVYPILLIFCQLRNDVHVDEDTLMFVGEFPEVNRGVPPEGLLPLQDGGDVLLVARHHLEGRLICLIADTQLHLLLILEQDGHQIHVIPRPDLVPHFLGHQWVHRHRNLIDQPTSTYWGMCRNPDVGQEVLPADGLAEWYRDMGGLLVLGRLKLVVWGGGAGVPAPVHRTCGVGG